MSTKKVKPVKLSQKQKNELLQAVQQKVSINIGDLKKKGVKKKRQVKKLVRELPSIPQLNVPRPRVEYINYQNPVYRDFPNPFLLNPQQTRPFPNLLNQGVQNDIIRNPQIPQPVQPPILPVLSLPPSIPVQNVPPQVRRVEIPKTRRSIIPSSSKPRVPVSPTRLERPPFLPVGVQFTTPISTPFEDIPEVQVVGVRKGTPIKVRPPSPRSVVPKPETLGGEEIMLQGELPSSTRMTKAPLPEVGYRRLKSPVREPPNIYSALLTPEPPSVRRERLTPPEMASRILRTQGALNALEQEGLEYTRYAGELPFVLRLQDDGTYDEVPSQGFLRHLRNQPQNDIIDQYLAIYEK